MPEHDTHADAGDDRAARRREQRRGEILAAAKQVFAERGFHRASINDIIEAAGIARGTFYLYFSSKNAVFESILDDAIEGLSARISRVEVGDGARPPGEQLHDNVTRVMGFVLNDRALIQLVLNHGLAPDSELYQRVHGFNHRVEALIKASLTYGISAGLVRDCDTDLVAAALFGAIRGIAGHLIDADQPADVAKVAEELIQFALRGVIVGNAW